MNQYTVELLSKGGMPPRNKKNFRPTEKGAGMTEAGVKAYRRKNYGWIKFYVRPVECSCNSHGTDGSDNEKSKVDFDTS